MSLFSCCPKKPKMTLDYVIKWVEETDKTLKEVVAWKEQIEEDDLKTLFDAYAESYPWDQVPIIGDLQEDVSELQHDLHSLETSVSSLETDVDSRLAARIEKPSECIVGNVPVWTGNIDLDGEGRAIEGGAPLADSVALITSGAVYTALQGKAPTTHYHSQIQCQRTATYIECEEEEGTGSILISVEDAQEGDDSAKITYNNMPNLKRALQKPDTTPVQNSTKLITSGAVYNKLQGKADLEHNHSIITNLAFSRSAIFEVDATSRNAVLELNDGATHKSVEINMDNIDNLNAVLQKNPVELLPADTGTFIILKDTTTGEYPLGAGEDSINDFVGTYSVNNYVPVVVTLQPTSAATGNKVLAFVQWKEPQTDTIVVYVYIGSVVFTIEGERVGGSITWTPDKWTKTDNSSF